jgi:Na+/H+ antiporter NhaD/arsenite permease-like protein
MSAKFQFSFFLFVSTFFFICSSWAATPQETTAPTAVTHATSDTLGDAVTAPLSATTAIATIHEATHQKTGHASTVPPIWMVIPFIILLLLIAILPLVAERWWESNLNKAIVSIFLGLPMGIYYLGHDRLALIHTMAEYISFIILLFALFTISGGILLKGDIRATPRNNSIYLAIGALLASFIGTTGAAMLLLRPVINTNAERQYKKHTIIFFIFTVCNIGGCLTPLGDPPLFLGYLKGVPFTWTFGLWREWLFMNTLLIAIYFLVDLRMYRKEDLGHIIEDEVNIEPISITGKINFLLVSGVVLSAALLAEPWREISMVALAITSLGVTKKEIRKSNDFNFKAITEVAVLFLGIFLTMIPALLLLKLRGGELGITEPWHYFWMTGMLSSFLDNAPTYLTFLSLSEGYVASAGLAVPEILAKVAITNDLLVAISLGAVFMGALTYIGNAPNFMVKAIAEEAKIKMPSFFGYMLWSYLVLLPLFILVTVIFIV